MISQNELGFSSNFQVVDSNISSPVNSLNSSNQTSFTSSSSQMSSSNVRSINKRKRRFDSICSTNEDSPYDSDDNLNIITGFEDSDLDVVLSTVLSKQLQFDKDVIFQELRKQRFVNQAKKYEQIKEQTINELRSNNPSDQPDSIRKLF